MAPRPQVTLWLADVGAADAACARAHLMSEPERARLQALGPHTPQGQVYGIGRVLRRCALAQHTGIAPDLWQFATDATGKPQAHAPRAACASANLASNLSHSGGWLVFAVAHSPHVGVDLELAGRFVGRSDTAQRICRRYFTAAEQAAVASLPPDDQSLAVLQLWALKEATLKAMGTGLRGKWAQVAPPVPVGPLGAGAVRWAAYAGPTSNQGAPGPWACALVSAEPRGAADPASPLADVVLAVAVAAGGNDAHSASAEPFEGPTLAVYHGLPNL